MGKFSMFMPAVCVLFFIKLHIKKVVTLFLKGKGLSGQDICCLHCIIKISKNCIYFTLLW